MHRQANKQTCKQQKDGHIIKKTNHETNRQIDRETYQDSNRHTKKVRNKQTEKQKI